MALSQVNSPPPPPLVSQSVSQPVSLSDETSGRLTGHDVALV